MLAEKKIEQLLRDAVRSVGGRAYKFVSPGNDGVPDRIVCLPDGKTIFVELKTAKGRLTKLQNGQIQRLEDMQQDVLVIYGVKGLVAFFDFCGMNEQADKIRRNYADEI